MVLCNMENIAYLLHNIWLWIIFLNLNVSNGARTLLKKTLNSPNPMNSAVNGTDRRVKTSVPVISSILQVLEILRILILTSTTDMLVSSRILLPRLCSFRTFRENITSYKSDEACQIS